MRPNHKEDLCRAIEINTVLWGGVYNPLIPLYKRIPPVWRDEFLRGPSAREVLEGYIATFEPDFLVKPDEADLPDNVFPQDRMISPSDVLSVPDPQEYAASRSPIRFGVDMNDVYTDEYRRAFQFVQRHPRKAEMPDVKGRFALLGACLWGTFPSDSRLAYYAGNFEGVFEAKKKTYASLDTLLFGALTPLRVTTHKLESSGRRPEPCLLALDETSLLDIIDFWNLRACGGLCVPLPMSRVQELATEIKKYMEDNARKRAVNATKLDYPDLITSRTLGRAAAPGIAQQLSLPKDKQLLLGHYPRLWSRQEASWDRYSPVSLYCEEKYGHTDVEEGRLTTDAPAPEFASRFGRYGPRWMNVVSMKEQHPERLPANVIPSGLAHVGRILGSFFPGKIWATDEGIAVSCEHKDSPHYWELPDARRIGEQWARERGYKLVLSDSGHILQSMVDVAGGLFSGRWFADAEILRELGKMAKGCPVPVKRLRGLLKDIYKNEPFSLDERNIDFFQEKGVLSLGLKVQCPHCLQYPWYALEGLGHKLTCASCLREFSFPFCGPPTTWCYRSLGPFAAPKLAQGAYSVFLALRFLDEQLDATTTCVPSCNLERETGGKLEADFICFWHKQSWREKGRHIIFGECKSFNDFDKKDIQRMHRVAQMFPRAVMAFCSLKDGLSQNEKRLIGSFAKSGWQPVGGDAWRTPVLILTGKELCVPMPSRFPNGLGGEWGELGRRMPSDWTIYNLCDASQHLYLGLPSRLDWLENYYKSKRKRKRRSK